MSARLSELLFASSFDRRTCPVCGPEKLHHYGCCASCDPHGTGRGRAPRIESYRPWKRAHTTPELRTQIRMRAEAGERRAEIAISCKLSKSAVQHILATID